MFIGLTGGIGTGKTTVSNYLKSKGYVVLDADAVAREIVEPGSETLSLLSDAFGEEILSPDGSLNRQHLAKIAFSDAKKKETLDRIMHGKIIEIMFDRGRRMIENEPFVFFDVPLLFESGMDHHMDQVWLVDASLEVQIQRVMERDKSSRQDVLRRIGHQMDRDEKIRRSTVILNNCRCKETLYRQIDTILNKLKEK
ncbi:MAG TPA: dephospho-CoA kinase [Anaerovoracaceae bacterium]|nr:dephospho-CoA kinase [Anaerovoracaceae bacterium]